MLLVVGVMSVLRCPFRQPLSSRAGGQWRQLCSLLLRGEGRLQCQLLVSQQALGMRSWTRRTWGLSLVDRPDRPDEGQTHEACV